MSAHHLRRPAAPTSPLCLVVVEAGAEAGRWATPGNLIVWQRPREGAGCFARRVRRMVESLARAGRRLAVAALVPGADAGPQALVARLVIALCLGQALVAGRGGVLVLDDDRGDEPTRRSLGTLGSVVTEQLGGTGVAVLRSSAPVAGGPPH